MTIYLTAEQVLFIHYRLVSETGGEHGVRDIGLLESAIARPKATFDGQELYTNIFDLSSMSTRDVQTKSEPFDSD